MLARSGGAACPAESAAVLCDTLAVSELMALYRFTVIGLHWQAAPPKKKIS